MTIVAAIAGLAIGFALFHFAGASVGPPTPMLLMLSMLGVVAAPWLIPIWHCAGRSKDNIHTLTAAGAFGKLETRIENRPLATNPKSSEMAALGLVRIIENVVRTFCLLAADGQPRKTGERVYFQ